MKSKLIKRCRNTKLPAETDDCAGEHIHLSVAVCIQILKSRKTGSVGNRASGIGGDRNAVDIYALCSGNCADLLAKLLLDKCDMLAVAVCSDAAAYDSLRLIVLNIEPELAPDLGNDDIRGSVVQTGAGKKLVEGINALGTAGKIRLSVYHADRCPGIETNIISYPFRGYLYETVYDIVRTAYCISYDLLGIHAVHQGKDDGMIICDCPDVLKG